MGCSSCGSNKGNPPSFAKSGKPNLDFSVPQHSVIKNMTNAAKSQKDVFRWFKDGVSGLYKCVTNEKAYSDEQIVKNRNTCEECPHSTKKNGKLFNTSQCMAPDPEKNGEVCGCFILCKTQVGKCPLNQFTDLTIQQT